MSWYVKVGSDWHPARDYQLAAIRSFLAEHDKPITISVPHGDGGDYVLTYKPATLDVADNTQLNFYTEEKKLVTFGFFERHRNARAERMHGEWSDRPRSRRSRSPRSGTRKSSSHSPATPESIHAMYDPGYAPPPWTLNLDEEWNQRASKVKIFTTRGADLDALIFCASEREPVNIAMTKHYTPKHDSGYTQFYNRHKVLAPNMAIYAKALISTRSMYLANPMKVRVINCIGFAFDDERQPDYKYFMKNYTAEKEQELHESLVNMFRMVFKCASSKKIKNVCLSFVGGGAFSRLFKPGATFRTYLDLFVASLAVAHSETNGIPVNIMGNAHALHRRVVDLGIPSKCVGFIPDILNESDLFVNAWDPHSIVGNGNANDESLDGYFGRLSDLWTLCTPAINPSMLERIVEVA